MNLYRNLYRKRAFRASMAVLLVAVAGLALAQTQKRQPHKLRATALLELTTDRAGNAKAQLTPITILADGRFEDASVYKATPQPMALDNGIVYEAQKSGMPVGYVTITNSTKGNIWTALGKWQTYTSVAKKAAPTPAPVENPSDGRPRLKRPGDTSSSSPTPSNPPSSNPTSSPTPDSGSGGDDRPHMKRPPADNSPSSSPTPEGSSTPSGGGSGGGSSGGSSDDRPRLHRPDDNQTSQPAPTSTPSAQTSPESAPQPEPDDNDRPVLRRRSPSAAGAARPAATPSSTPSAGAKATPTPTGTVTSTVPKPPAAGTQTLVAVSDNQSSESRSFEFIWKPGEQEVMEAKMRKLALAQLPQENAQLNDGSLRDVVIRSFDLDLSNDAVMVLTAEIPGSYMAPPAKTAPGKKTASRKAAQKTGAQDQAAQDTGPGKFVSRYITLIARVDFEGVPQRLAVSVTDSSRLDVAPRLELIDAVDVDGDGLAELLFREYGFDQKGFIVYGIGRSTVTKVFEGASQDLK
jgi:hypothetical protein